VACKWRQPVSEGVAVLDAQAAGQMEPASVRRIGPELVFGRLWQQSGLPEVLRALLKGRRYGFELERAIYLTVLHRLFAHGSDRAAERWRAQRGRVPMALFGEGRHRLQVKSHKGDFVEALLKIRYPRLQVLSPVGKRKEPPNARSPFSNANGLTRGSDNFKPIRAMGKHTTWACCEPPRPASYAGRLTPRIPGGVASRAVPAYLEQPAASLPTYRQDLRQSYDAAKLSASSRFFHASLHRRRNWSYRP
jgi:hypothetical protein